MKWTMRAGATIAAIATMAMVAVAEQARPRTQRTTMTFDSAVMVPGATLQPGTYTFELMDSRTSRHTVRILTDDGTKTVAVTQAVPTHRLEPSEDTVLKFAPASGTAPVALQAWFYPGASYGHEFIYTEEEARQIAERTKTLVLSGDTSDTADGSGTLYIYDANGNRRAWPEDQALVRAWQLWYDTTVADTVRVEEPGTPETRESTAPIIRPAAAQDAVAADITDLEDDPDQFLGRQIRVTGEVDEVLGPRLFTIDESNWFDFDGETVVYVPTGHAAVIKEGDQVTVTGMVRLLRADELQPELLWFEDMPDADIPFDSELALVASDVIGGNNNTALWIDAKPTSPDATSMPGSRIAVGSMLMDASAVARGGDELVGRSVNLERVTIKRVGTNHGFWVDADNASIFVMPSHFAEPKLMPRIGESVAIKGTVLSLPPLLFRPTGVDGRAHAEMHANNDIYIYATTVKTVK